MHYSVLTQQNFLLIYSYAVAQKDEKKEEKKEEKKAEKKEEKTPAV